MHSRTILLGFVVVLGAVSYANGGGVQSCGANDFGQLGTGNASPSNEPLDIAGLDDTVAVSAGNEFSIALRANGTLMGWGHNYWGEVGDGTRETPSRLSPVPVVNLNSVAAISSGWQ